MDIDEEAELSDEAEATDEVDTDEKIEVQSMLIDVSGRNVYIDHHPVELTAKEFDLALYMFRNVGKLLAREQILKDIWQVSGLNTRTVDMHVSRIKKHLQIAPQNGYRVKTIYQHGYRLEALEQS